MQQPTPTTLGSDEFPHLRRLLQTIDEEEETDEKQTTAAHLSSKPPAVPPKDQKWVTGSSSTFSSTVRGRLTKDSICSNTSGVLSQQPKASTAITFSSPPRATSAPPVFKPKSECMVCFDEFESEQIFHTQQCEHLICGQCLATYLTTYSEVRHEDYGRIPCPGHQCQDGMFESQEIVPRVMSASAADAWWFKIIRRDILETYGYCPYGDCKAMFELDDVEIERQQQVNRNPRPAAPINVVAGISTLFRRRRHRRQSQAPPPQRTMVECPKCHRGICLWCEHGWHDGLCTERPTGRWRRKQQTLPEALIQDDIQRKHSMAARQLALKNGWTRCPSCREVIARTQGCNTISCRCGYEFCYRCGSRSSSHTCQRNCHKLSNKKLQQLRKEMYEKRSSEMSRNK